MTLLILTGSILVLTHIAISALAYDLGHSAAWRAINDQLKRAEGDNQDAITP